MSHNLFAARWEDSARTRYTNTNTMTALILASSLCGLEEEKRYLRRKAKLLAAFLVLQLLSWESCYFWNGQCKIIEGTSCLVTPHIRRHPWDAKTLIHCATIYSGQALLLLYYYNLVHGGSSTSTFLQRNTQPTVLQFLERLRASQTQFNLLGQGRGLGTWTGRRQNVDHSPGFVPPPDFCPRGKSDKIRPWLGTKVYSALAETGIQTTNTFLQESANIIFVWLCDLCDCDTQNILDFKQPSPIHHTELSLAYLISKALGCVQQEPELVEWHGKTFREEENAVQR